MFDYKSNEMNEKFKGNTERLDHDKLLNKEILGLYLIGEISYKEMYERLDLTEQQGRDFLEGLAFQLSKHVSRDDRNLNISLWDSEE